MDINSLPDSELKTILCNKYEVKKQSYPSIISELNKFCDYVSQEISQINELFTEYTPHDTKYHVSRLFNVADIILGKERYEYMNFAELYILAAGLFAHDWGMAVSKTERNYIATGKTYGEREPEDFILISNENLLFQDFLNKNKIKWKISSDEEIKIELWREYIRNTHARRSAERSYQYFEGISGGLASSISKVCLGHWLDIEDICEEKGFYSDADALGENINLKALAIYIRLIDLFDLAEDRTPYVIWKYINPKDMQSISEWKKHRALNPITCPARENGRILSVSGSTNDHIVYAALEDFKNVCEKYFKESIAVLARMNDVRHRLDIYYIDWRIEARGFKPISIQFEFNREKMFDILSNDIYDGDSYIFLRELLQNSIDAIKMRREVLKKNNIGGENIGIIKIEVTTEENGDINLLWEDDGIGMDEYIIKNYLAVAGKSYYCSRDFESEGFDINPISRFGIGLLSCFMVSDSLDIITYREPYIQQGANTTPLHIMIPDIKYQFRIEALSTQLSRVGTKIKLNIKHEKLNDIQKKSSIEGLKVTEYLKYIAGFVEFPIVIDEDKKKTIILNRKYNLDVLKHNICISEYDIYSINLKHIYEKMFLPQDIESAKELLEEKEIKISNQEYDLFVTYFDLKDEVKDFVNLGRCWPADSVQLIDIHNDVIGQIRWKKRGRSCINEFNRDMMNENYSCKIFNDGILIENEEFYSFDRYREDNMGVLVTTLPNPKIIVNIHNELKQDIAISRTKTRSKKDYFKEIWNAYQKKVCDNLREKLEVLSGLEVLRELAKAIIINRVSINFLWEYFVDYNILFPFLEPDGTINFYEIKNEVIYLSSDDLSVLVRDLYYSAYINKPYERNLVIVEGEKSLIKNFKYDSYLEKKSIFSIMIEIIKYFYQKQYYLDGVEFFEMLSPDRKIILQEKWIKCDKKSRDLDNENKNEIYLKIIADNYTASTYEMSLIHIELEKIFKKLPKFVSFGEKYKDYIIYGENYINIDSLFGKYVLKTVLATLLMEKDKTKDKLKIGRIFDMFENLPFFCEDIPTNKNKWRIEAINKELADIVKELKELGLEALEINVIELTIDDLVPDTIECIQEHGLTYFKFKDK